MRIAALALGLTLLASAPAAADCDKLAKLPLGKAVPVLDGHLTLQPLQGAKVLPEAPHMRRMFGRVLFQSGSTALMVIARERFEVAKKGGVADLARAHGKAVLGNRPYDVSALKVGGGLEAYEVAPDPLPGKKGIFLALDVLVRHGDGFVQLVSFFVDEASSKDASACRKAATRVAATLAAGPRRISQKAGKRQLLALGRTFEITVPDDMIVQPEIFGGRQVYWVKPLGKRLPVIGVYVGDDPKMHAATKTKKAKVEFVEGKLLGKDVLWMQRLTKRKDGPDYHHLEVVAPLTSKPKLSVHVFITTEKLEQLPTFKKIAETLRVKK